jgi:Family of unknown function (DUF6399)/IclR helix-turn-helix domain
MGFWEKSLRIVNYLSEVGTRSVRQIAQHTGLSKSSTHRLQQAMKRRNGHAESWLWETAEGRHWLGRLVVATLYTFGLKRGVGVDTISEFFSRLHLVTQVGSSPGALRNLMQALEQTIVETGQAWEKEGTAGGDVLEIIGAVDETFLEQMLLVFLDLPSGYVLLEEVAEDRSYATWKALVDTRLEALGARVRSLVSDRAQALIQLAEQGLECLSIPDVFHLMHDIVKSYSLAMGRQVKRALQDLETAEACLQRHQGGDAQSAAHREATRQVEVAHAEVKRWEGIQHEYRQRLETISLTLHPFRSEDSAPQTSQEVGNRVQAQVQAIAALAQTHPWPERQKTLKKVTKHVPALAALVDFWWAGVHQDLEHAAISPLWRTWAQEALLPMVYWRHQITRTRCARRKTTMQQALEGVQATFAQHTITQCLPRQALEDWHAWATRQVQAFQRASSAVEGRNGTLAQLHHNQRGLPKQRYKVWAVLHNFDGRAADGTTPAARFFRRAFPDLFETVFSHIGALPQPRQRKRAVVLRH